MIELWVAAALSFVQGVATNSEKVWTPSHWNEATLGSRKITCCFMGTQRVDTFLGLSI